MCEWGDVFFLPTGLWLYNGADLPGQQVPGEFVVFGG